jgi:2-oxoglutarate dehydrogenase E2 component (dihydrolipoamide succinyltransferase)
MQHNVVAPSVGESITEVSILKWAKPDGAQVKPGDLLLEIESDKATVEIVAEFSGRLSIAKQAGERVGIGAVIGMIDDAAQGTVAAAAPSAAPSAPAPAAAPARPAAAPAGAAAAGMAGPAARKLATEAGYDLGQIPGTGKDGRVTKGDVLGYSANGGGTGATAAAAPTTALQAGTTIARAPQPAPSAPQPVAPAYKDRAGDRRVPMTNLRARIAERLVQAQHTAAILTTFNEADMSAVNALRAKHKEAFKAKHGVNLGFMSFFTRACVEAFKVVPEVNASIDGRDVVYHDYVDMGIAVGSDRGLVVPVLKDAHKMGFADIEKKIFEFATKAKDGKLSIADLAGGTFTISNGGTYGSLLSTPILTPPQAGILGMHKIQDRPMVVEDANKKKTIEIRPMMYLALSYDHRLIDGKGAVTFLVTVKDFLEHPEKLGLNY